MHFLRGRVLEKLGRYAEAKTAYERAHDEDVCPLRAPREIREILTRVATERQVPPLMNLCKTLGWAGKLEEAYRAGGRAAELESTSRSGNGSWQALHTFHHCWMTGSAAMRAMSPAKSLPTYSKELNR